jgi:hypothetical protein
MEVFSWGFGDVGGPLDYVATMYLKEKGFKGKWPQSWDAMHKILHITTSWLDL